MIYLLFDNMVLLVLCGVVMLVGGCVLIEVLGGVMFDMIWVIVEIGVIYVLVGWFI